ncbi:MAG: thioredoxin family protein [Ignavibacteriales bacterium]|nr:thioredoxin family protein [Ignavibacteriales bacterium]
MGQSTIPSQFQIGSPLPEFSNLPGVDGKKYSSSDSSEKKILVVAFTCNHCPYVQAYEERIMTLQKEYAEKSVQVICINSNEIENYPDDSYEKMMERAKLKNFNFIYLRDEDQTVANKFFATHTPEFFVFDSERKLRYHGRLDDNWQKPEEVKETYLQYSIDSLLRGEEVKIPETFSIGCTIKWKL